ncbi:hypothetical protein [Parabacteroides sp. Marseille-P3160]|uniref:hypothetical protein n=1 Tax=Parabacteroides sp. Marseille-P3160 TaxID=1917887 RepID=UPI0009BBD6F9|nr:hypothetical protein [Parabacteroides sp. Marseille-P3160]
MRKFNKYKSNVNVVDADGLMKIFRLGELYLNFSEQPLTKIVFVPEITKQGTVYQIQITGVGQVRNQQESVWVCAFHILSTYLCIP